MTFEKFNNSFLDILHKMLIFNKMYVTINILKSDLIDEDKEDFLELFKKTSSDLELFFLDLINEFELSEQEKNGDFFYKGDEDSKKIIEIMYISSMLEKSLSNIELSLFNLEAEFNENIGLYTSSLDLKEFSKYVFLYLNYLQTE